MEYDFLLGSTFSVEREVLSYESASTYGSGTVDVFATPALIAFIEKTSLYCIGQKLPTELTSVGIAVNIEHIKATTIGMMVKCDVKVTQINGKKVVFDVQCFDQGGLIGMGTHTRYIVNAKQFMEKVQSK